MNTKNNIISGLWKSLSSRPEVRTLIPMGYTPGMPALTVKNGYLCAVIPYLRYKVTGKKDLTLVFPVKYVLTYSIPECQTVGFVDLEYSRGFDEFDFDRAVGTFRHEAIKELTAEDYNQLRAATLSYLDDVVSIILEGEEVPEDLNAKLAGNMQTIVEPSIAGIYRLLTPDFFNSYIKTEE